MSQQFNSLEYNISKSPAKLFLDEQQNTSNPQVLPSSKQITWPDYEETITFVSLRHSNNCPITTLDNEKKNQTTEEETAEVTDQPKKRQDHYKKRSSDYLTIIQNQSNSEAEKEKNQKNEGSRKRVIDIRVTAFSWSGSRIWSLSCKHCASNKRTPRHQSITWFHTHKPSHNYSHLGAIWAERFKPGIQRRRWEVRESERGNRLKMHSPAPSASLRLMIWPPLSSQCKQHKICGLFSSNNSSRGNAPNNLKETVHNSIKKKTTS